jgi:hypothetical protein
MEILEYLVHAGGAARTDQLLAAGYSRRDIAGLLELGVRQPRRGIFLAPGCDGDGYAFHSKRADMLRDRDRNNTSTVKGYAVLRYMPEHIWFNQQQVLTEIRAALALRAAPSS